MTSVVVDVRAMLAPERGLASVGACGEAVFDERSTSRATVTAASDGAETAARGEGPQPAVIAIVGLASFWFYVMGINLLGLRLPLLRRRMTALRR